MFVKAAPGALVRDPFTMLELPPEGAEVDETSLHWDRALRDGDIVPADPPAPPEPAKPAKGGASSSQDDNA